MFRWVPYPFVRFVAVLIAGILTGIYFPGAIPIKVAIISLVFLAVVFGFLFSFRRKIQNIQDWTGVVGLSFIFLIGYVHLFYKNGRNNEHNLFHQNDTIRYYTAVVVSQPQEKKNTWKVEAEMQLRFADKWERADAKIILYLSKRDFENPFHYGDVLLIKGGPQLVPPPNNPHGFDYQQYLSFQNIYHQHYLREGEVRFVRSDPPYKILQLAFIGSEWARNTLKRYIKGEHEQAIVLGLVLGIKDGLDNELISAYSASGGMHVLAVSGLHVGILYWIVLLVLRPIGKSRKGKTIVTIMGVLILWAYALITGLSPSVLRAVTMFTFVAVALPFRHRTNIYNTLAISACCLLLYNPYFIMAVGFQLSYAAVLGIVYFQPKFTRVFSSRYYLVTKTWELSSVSIAAQIATFPLGLLYFHQFPVYFLFSNLFIIPCAFIILIGGLAVLVSGFFSPIATVLGFCLSWIVKALNASVFFVESFPYSLIENVYLTTFQCWLIVLAILSFICLMEFRRFRFLMGVFFLVALLSFQQGQHLMKNSAARKLTVYNISGHSAIDIFEKGTVYTFLDSALSQDNESVRFHIRPNRLVLGANHILAGDSLPFCKRIEGCTAIKRNAISIVWVTEKQHRLPDNGNFDFLVVSNNALSSSADLGFRPKAIIIDSSNSSYLAKELTSQARKSGLVVHNTRTDGAFVFEQKF